MIKPVKSVKDLDSLCSELNAKEKSQTVIRVCSTGCRALGALDVCCAFENEILERGLSERISVVRAGCHGFCAGAVAIVIDPQGIFYRGVKSSDVKEIIESTVLKGDVIDRLCYKTEDDKALCYQKDIPFYQHQTKLLLRNCGVLDPSSLSDSIKLGGYKSAGKAMETMSPEDIISEVINSGLRGRGGAGFSTGKKWQFARGAKSDQKYIICNADEGDPGAFMDRALLEGDPHLVIEGMCIGAYAIGASKGIIYVRAEYPIAIEHTEIAIREAREIGLLGENILGTDFSFDLEIRMGAGAFVCGEETSLIASTEGKRGMPRPRPPFPAVSGLYGKPTNINNVETWANVPRIIEMGASEYAKIGTEGSKGTKIFALAGKVGNTGLVEVPMGTTLRDIVFKIGGGVPNGKKFKAAQMGGPSGGCVTADHLDLPIDYDSVQKIGAIMGSGGLIVMDEDTCMVDIARFFTNFVQEESCGKCVPCRIGTKRMLETLEGFTRGEGVPEDIDKLANLGEKVKQASLCGLGQTAPNPVLSTIRFFRDEYEAHIIEKRCPAKVCQPLLTYRILQDLCTGCTACVKGCPTDAISGEKKCPHTINVSTCIKCGACQQICRFDAVVVE